MHLFDNQYDSDDDSDNDSDSSLEYAITSLTFCQNSKGEFLVSGDQKGRVQIWDAKTWRPVILIKAHTKEVQCIAFDQNNLLATSSVEDLDSRSCSRSKSGALKQVN